jgi:hypothetical protein
MAESFQPVFARLRDLLKARAGDFHIADDSSDRYCLEAPVGATTLRAWGSKVRKPLIPVAWVEIGKTYVGYHVIGVTDNPTLMAGLSQQLRARLQGKSCFNFTTVDEALFRELDQVTAASLRGLQKAGYISNAPLASGTRV